MPLARLDASGDKTEQGGLGTQDDPVLPPLPLGEGGGEGHAASKTIAARASQTGAEGPNHSKPAANDAEALYWASLNQQAEQKAQALAIEGWGTGTDGPARQTAQAKIAEVYYFHTDQVGLPEELSNSQGQLVWQATYKTWGNTQAEEWKLVEADGSKTHPLDAGDQPENEARQQNLRFQGQYLDRDTGLHYNTFRYYDPDIGRFISPDPISLEGGLNLASYSPNPTGWIDPLGLANEGTYAGERSTHVGGETNHSPAFASYKDIPGAPSKYSGPAFHMDYADHRSMTSTGSSNAAKIWRARQNSFIKQGRWDKAMEMDINEAKQKFGSKYTERMKRMVRETFNQGRITQNQKRRLLGKC